MTVCIPNIGPRQRRRRLLLAYLGTAAATAMALFFAMTDAPSIVRAGMVFPLTLAAYGFFQYREKT